MGVFNWLANRFKGLRGSINAGFNSPHFYFGAIYKIHYTNWKHDPEPLIWIQYSDARYTHALNMNYASFADKLWLGRIIYMMKKSRQIMNGAVFYQYLKTNRPSLIKTSYRVYHTGMCLSAKLVCAGVTSLDKMVYTFNDPWIYNLNKQLQPSELSFVKEDISYSTTELRDRIISAQNSQSLNTMRVGKQPQPAVTNLAPWVKR